MTNEQEQEAARLRELPWFKSSYSGSSGASDCVEVAHAVGTTHVRDSKDQRGPILSLPSAQWTSFIDELSWHKSTYSGPDGGNCVEVAQAAGTVHVRDSKEQCGPVLSVPSAQWARFIGFAGDSA